MEGRSQPHNGRTDVDAWTCANNCSAPHGAKPSFRCFFVLFSDDAATHPDATPEVLVFRTSVARSRTRYFQSLAAAHRRGGLSQGSTLVSRSRSDFAAGFLQPSRGTQSYSAMETNHELGGPRTMLGTMR